VRESGGEESKEEGRKRGRGMRSGEREREREKLFIPQGSLSHSFACSAFHTTGFSVVEILSRGSNASTLLQHTYFNAIQKCAGV
jgi:hypothetical protein